MSMIKELYYETLAPQDVPRELAEEVSAASQELEACEEALGRRLTGTDKSLLLDLINAYSLYAGALSLSSFASGFALGGRLFWETAESSRARLVR